MNQIHGRFEIANDDFLYVLSAMVLEPLRWNERLGWRRMEEGERQAQFHFWHEIGTRMAIQQIPDSLAELERFNVSYERTRFAATEAGSRLAQAQQNVFLAWFPWLPNKLGARSISALLEPDVVEALGLVRPTAFERRASEAALRLRALALKPLPARSRPRLRTTMRRRSYPDGYTIEQLGPPPASTPR
jgi:hypothetical protein